MKIALVSDFFLDFVGGAQSSIHEQKAALEDAGHQVLLVAAARLNWATPLRATADGLRIRPWFTASGFEFPIIRSRPRLVGALRDYFEHNGVEIVHVQTEFGLAHAATTAARELGIPVVHTVHTFYWQTAGWWQSPLAPLLRRSLEAVTGQRLPRQRLSARASDNLLRNLTLNMALRVDAVISPSAHQARDLRDAGVSIPISTIPNPIARHTRQPLPLTVESASRPRLLWVARCVTEKRPLVFAAAAIEALERTGDAFEVDFVGDGSELAALRQLTDRNPHIHVHGMLPHVAVLDLIDASSVVALTSVDFDNQPMTIAEAVSRYRGVLYCDPKLSEGLQRAGYQAASVDSRGLADAIVHLVSSPEPLVALSAGAQLDSEVFSARAYVSSVVGVYSALQPAHAPVS